MSWVFMYMSKRRLIIGISGKYGCLFDEDLGVVRYHENRWYRSRKCKRLIMVRILWNTPVAGVEVEVSMAYITLSTGMESVPRNNNRRR